MANHGKASGTKRAKEASHQRRTARSVRPGPAAVNMLLEDSHMLQRALENPGAASPQAILALQRTAGNRAVSRLIQTKLMVGRAGDRYEREADRVAEQVMGVRIPASGQRPAHSAQPAVQRQDEEAAEPVQAKPLAGSITLLMQRQDGLEGQEMLQGKPSVRRRAGEGGFEAGVDIENRLNSTKGGGKSLPSGIRAEFESKFGVDFSGVRVHTGGEAVQMNRELSAQAFTHGQDIYLGAGRYDPGTTAGKRLLAHELTHVVQQTGHSAQPKSTEDAGRKRTQANLDGPKMAPQIGIMGVIAPSIIDGSKGGIRVIQRKNDLEVVATYGGQSAAGKNGHEKATRAVIAEKKPRLYNSLENVSEPLSRSKFACAEASALANLLKTVAVPTRDYKEIEFGPAKFAKNYVTGKGTDIKYFPKGSNYQRCENCQQWLQAPDYKRIIDL